MNKVKRILSLSVIAITLIVLGACAKTVENEHLPEYCRTYSGFMATASPDLYNKIGDINQFNYLSVISEIEIDWTEDDPTREFNLDGIQCFQNLTSLTLRGASFKDISQISALKNIQSITLEDTSIVSISSFKNLSKVNYLSITGSYSLQSVDGVEEMTKLTHLDLSNNGIVDINELNSLVNLEVLILDNNQITFFPNINQLEHLTTLSVVNNGIEELGDDLSGLSNLIVFNAAHNNIKDLSSLDDLTSIEELILNDNDLGFYGVSPDFSALENAPNLEILNLENNNLTSISGLSGKDLPLDKLYLSGNLLTDITPISGFTELRVLELSDNLISNIDDLSGMVNLTSINLDHNLITDFSDLLGIEGLQVVNLSDNEIIAIPVLRDSWPNLISLDLRNNLISDTSGIEGHPTIYELDLRNNNLTILEGISDVPNLSILTIDQDPEELDEDGEVIVEDNPNAIRVIINSFNNTAIPLVNTVGNYELMLPFSLHENAEIYGSFNDIYNLQIVDLAGMEIDIIDEESFNNEDTYAIYVDDNNLQDISFLLNNPEVREINISENPVNSLSVLSGVSTSDFDNVTAIDASNIPTANSLNGAFVDLPSLITLNVQNTEFDSIVDSFNGLNNLSTLTISSESITEIIGSFNNLQPASAPYSITLSSGELGYISNSFNNGTFQVIGILNQNPGQPLTIIENSFNDLVVTSNGGMVISDSSFHEINNSFNRSTFVQLGISSSQVNEITDSFDQTTINTTLSLNTNNLTTVDLSGLITVSNLYLTGNTLTDISFLETMSTIEALTIDVDLVDFSIFETVQFRSTLETLDLTSFQVIPDLSIFSEYDGVTLLTLNTPNTEINQLDGMDSLENIIFTNPQVITTFTSSFNNMPSLVLHDDDLSYFEALTTINNSFDVYGVGFNEVLLLPEDVNVTDSFNNLLQVSIDVNALDTTPRFDAFSFDNLIFMSLNGANYNSYAQLNNYIDLKEIVFNNHLGDITDLNHNGVDNIYIDALTGDTFNITMGNLGLLDIIADVITLHVSSNNVYYSLSNNGNVVLNATNSTIDVNAEGNTVEINGSSLTSLTYITNDTSTLNVNADLLGYIGNRNIVTGSQVFEVNVYSTQTNVESSINANQLNIHNNGLSVLTVSDSDTVEVFSTSPVLSIVPDVQTLVLNNNALTDLTIPSGSLTELQAYSSNLSSINANGADVGVINASTDQTSLDILSGSTQLLDITGSNITSLNAEVGTGNLTLNNFVTTLSLSGTMKEVDITNGILQVINIDTTSTISGTLTTNTNGLHTISAGNANVADMNITSNVATMTINGSAIGAVIIDNSSISTLNMNAPSTNVSLTSSNTSLVMNTDITDMSISNPLLQTINVTTNGLETLDLQTARQVSQINITGTISTIVNRSQTASLDVFGSVLLLDISSVNITNLTANIGTGNLNFTSSNTGVISFDLIAKGVVVSTSGNTVVFSNSSDLTILDMETSTVENLLLGSADVDFLVFDDTNTGTLSINGSNVLEAAIRGGFSVLDLTLSTTDVTVEADGLSPEVTTNTTGLNVSSIHPITINAPLLTDLNATAETVILNGSGTTLSVLGNMQNLTIDSADLNTINLDSVLVLDELYLNNVNIATLSTVNALNVVEIISNNVTTFSINTTTLSDLVLEGDNLSFVDASLGTGELSVTTVNNSLDIDGTFNKLTVEGDFLTSLDLLNVSTEEIDIKSNSLSTINTGTALSSGSLLIDSTASTMDVTTLATDITFQGNTSLHATLHSTITATISVSTPGTQVTFDTPNGNVILSGTNLSQLHGSVESLQVNGTTGPTLLTLDLTSTYVQVDNDIYVTIFTVGSNTIGTLTLVSDSLALVATNDVTITSLNVTSNTDILTLDSKASSIIHTGSSDLDLSVYASTIVNTTAQIVNADSTVLGTLNLTMNGPQANKFVSVNNVDNAIINTGIGTDNLDFSLSGLNTSWTLDGIILESIHIEDVSMTDLSNIINTLDTLTTLEINLLSNSNLAALITDLEGTGISLTSPITQSEVLAYYYDVEYNALDNATERDNRYALIEQGYIDDAYNTMIANTYFQHWLEADLRIHIGDSSGSAYRTQQEYFDDYITNVLGFIDEADMLADEAYTQTDIDNIKASIQSVLDDPSLSIPTSVQINNEIQNSIESDATLLSNAAFANKGFSLIELP